MILALVLAQLSTPLNLNGQAIYRVSCDGGIACAKSGQSLSIVGTGSGGSGTPGAPVDGGFVVWTSVGSSNERVLTAGTNVTIDTSTPGQIVVNSTSSGGGGTPWDGGAYVTVEDEGGALTQRSTLNFAGAGVTCADDTTRTTCTIAGGGGGYNLVQDEGSNLTARTTIDFTGAGVTCTDTGAKTACDIPGGGSGGASPLSLILGTP